jgi:aflatoxin B1 aldehyde reductase
MMRTPRVILGTMTFGGATTTKDATTMVLDFCQVNKWKELVKDNPMLDSAIMYQNGKTEVVLGEIMMKDRHNDMNLLLPTTLSLSSKANSFTKDKNLSPSGVRKQLESSLKSFGRDSIDIYYLHAPDSNNSIEPTLEEIQKLYNEKKFNKFGLSNFSAWETVYIHGYMSTRNYILPTVYQGMYNAITRQVETELFPALRKLGMNFYAYNPLGGGMLSGKYSPSINDKEAAKKNSKKGDRFSGNSLWAKRYRERFQQKEQFDALEIVREKLQQSISDDDNHGNDVSSNNTCSSMAEASLRWLRHHSQLKEDDGIIIGASKISHYNSNMKSLSAGHLSNDLVEAFDNAAKLCQDVCPDYSRGYSGSSVR